MTACIESVPHAGGIVELRMARPPVNALDPDLCGRLRDAVQDAVDGGAQGLVLSSAAKVFSAGLDVPHLLSLGDDRAALMQAWETFFGATRALAGAPVPVVAAITGHAPAGGCVLALCCDYRVMASGPYRIGLNETRVGLAAPEGVQRLLRRVVGPYRAERMLVSGEMVDAEHALRVGLVDEVVDIDSVVQRATVWLDHLVALPREAMLATRAMARADLIEALEPQHIQLEHFIEAWYRPDCQQALQALVARLGK